MPADLLALDISSASQLVQKRTVSPVELTEACLKRIEQFDKQLNSFITVTAESAMQEARLAESEISRGAWKGPLHGIPLALKDLVETAGVKTTGASAVLKDFIPTQDAPIVQRLKAAGAILLGKLNLHEFAYGGSGMIGHFGIVKNPWNTAHITGGSSSGSAAAVAAGLCYGAIGTDTAGSIRLPAAYCGIVGLKPSYGLVSTRGVIPLSFSHDHAGPMTRSVTDAALMLQVIASYDPQDICAQKFPAVHYPAAMEEKKISSLRLATSHEFFWKDLDPEIEKAVDDAIALLAGITAGARDLKLPVPADRTVFVGEPYAYHLKYLPDHTHEYHPETLRRISTGADVTTSNYIEKHQQMQRIRRQIIETFEEIDLLITPTCPVPAPKIAELEAAPDQLRPTELVMLRNTRPFNVWGLPTISIPCGFSQSGLPIGLQITGAPGEEATVLALAHAYEEQTEWHTRRPNAPANQ